MKTSNKLFLFISLFFLFLLYGLLMTQKINLTTGDIGRHIRNGEIFVKTHTIIRTNYYSYTEPDFPVVTHHWGSGIIFYAVYKFFGFTGISLFFTIVSLITFLIFFQIARKKGGTILAVLVSFIFLPLLADRTEIRPEVFSYLLVGMFFYLLHRYKEDGFREKYLLFLPLLLILWVNLHIYFFVGILLIGIFFLDMLISSKFRLSRKAIWLLIVFILSNLVTLLNPFGVEGAIAPYFIFKNYGYEVLENQTVWFLMKTLYNPDYLIYQILFFFLAGSFLFALWRARGKISISSFILAVIFSAMAWKAVRNLTLFAFFAVVFFTENLCLIFMKSSVQKFFYRFAPIMAGFSFFFFLLFISGSLFTVIPKSTSCGTGIWEGMDQSVLFFKREKLKGPIFNNYDIGGYLIFYLFPKERVFVDNRPEAYSIDFFQKTYIPMQQDDKVWHKTDGKYHFNVIYFRLYEATPWSQDFLDRRVHDREWAPVYADIDTLILLRRTSENEPVIKKYELPQEMFKMVKINDSGKK